jgi:isopenicillin N synthase-like dioxygenase
MPVLYTPPKVAPIPVIDIDPSRPPDDVAAEIRSAALDTGFFYIKNHGVDQAVIDGAFAACARFFALPLDAKERIPRTPTTKGYEGMEKQHLDPGSAPDIKESWNCGWDRGPRTPGFAENKWPRPEELSEALFKDPIETYYRAVDGVATNLMPHFARSLSLPWDYFAELFRNPGTSLRVLCYPPQPENPKFNQMGAGAHTDGSVFTILSQDDCGGLEVQDVHGDFMRAEVMPGTFVVNIGDTLARWTNDRFKSTVHRVMHAITPKTRYSMAFFYSPGYYTKIECIPTCLEPGEQPKYEPVTMGEHSNYRLSRSRGVKNPVS